MTSPWLHAEVCENSVAKATVGDVQELVTEGTQISRWRKPHHAVRAAHIPQQSVRAQALIPAPG